MRANLLRPDAFVLSALGAVNPLPIPDCPKLLRRRLLRFGAANAASGGRSEPGKSLGRDVLSRHAVSVRPAGLESKRRRKTTQQEARSRVRGGELDSEHVRRLRLAARRDDGGSAQIARAA